jgi:hypothetical protein
MVLLGNFNCLKKLIAITLLEVFKELLTSTVPLLVLAFIDFVPIKPIIDK